MKFMNYFSTRGGDAVTASQAIVAGIAPSGGLYVPECFPAADLAAIAAMTGYADVAAAVMAALRPWRRSRLSVAFVRAASIASDTRSFKAGMT